MNMDKVIRELQETYPDKAIIKNFQDNPLSYMGRDPRLQFVHEEDAAEAFTQAIFTKMTGVYNVVPDDSIRLSELNRLIGVKFAPRLPTWLAHLAQYVLWRYFGSSVHPSWIDTFWMDAVMSNARLKSTGWTPWYTSEAAVRSAVVGAVLG